jgi:hypothetical protein
MNARPPVLQKPSWILVALGLGLIALVSLPPLVGEPLPIDFLQPAETAGWAGKLLIVLLMATAVAAAALTTRTEDRWSAASVAGAAILAALMTAWHWYRLDSDPFKANWQRGLYLDILNHRTVAPHLYRTLPFGFTRTLERLTGDWLFSCVAYRWFFTFWFVWGSYRFARLFYGQGLALLTMVPLVVLYPLSVQYYWGQLTDPLSHALFVFSLIWLIQDRWLLLAAALALGVMAKETVVLVVLSYFVCYLRQGWPALIKTSVLGLACAGAFLATRLPLGWQLSNSNINGTDALMIGTNLGLGEPLYNAAAPLYENYLHPLWFVGAFVPPIAWSWRRLDYRLRVLLLTLTPTLLLSNLCFSWMYESRNYMPLVPLHATAALAFVGASGGADARRPDSGH